MSNRTVEQGNDELDFFVEALEEYMEEQYRPPLEEGEYLAFVSDVEKTHSKSIPGGFNICWTFTINSSDYTREWDRSPDAYTIELRRWTPWTVPDDDDTSKQVLHPHARMTLETAACTGSLHKANGKHRFQPELALKRLVKVSVGHEDDNRTVGDAVPRRVCRIRWVGKYINPEGQPYPILDMLNRR